MENTVLKSIIAATAIILTSTAVSANTITEAESLGKCAGIAQKIIDDFQIDIILSDKWDEEKLINIVNISFERYHELAEATTEGMDRATAKAVESRMGEKFDYGYVFAEGWASGGLNNVTNFSLDKCK